MVKRDGSVGLSLTLQTVDCCKTVDCVGTLQTVDCAGTLQTVDWAECRRGRDSLNRAKRSEPSPPD